MTTTSTEEYQLLRAVLDNPADDLPRLILADWLQEHGQDERAEFIREQCEGGRKIDRFGDIFTGDKAVLLLADNRELIHETAKLFGATNYDRLMDLYSYVGMVGRIEWTWHRGFISEIKLPLAAFVGNACGCGGHPVRSGGFTPWGAPVNMPCPECDGAGHMPGVASAVFRNHPVERVTLIDTRCRVVGNHNSFGWSVGPCHFPNDPWTIPGAIFELLPPTGAQSHRSERWKWYRSDAESRSALSHACVAYGRSFRS